MPWSFRSVSAEEKAALLGTFGEYPKSTRQGCISNLAHYGAHIVLIPMMGGGFLGAVLKVVGVPEKPAYLIGVALAGMASLLIFRRNRSADARFRESWERRRQAVQAIDALPVFTLHVTKVWFIDSELDWPSYLFRDPDQGYILLCTDQLQFQEPTFAHEELEVTCSPDREAILELRWSGRSVALEEPVLPIPHDEWPGDGALTLVPVEAIPAQWRPIVN